MCGVAGLFFAEDAELPQRFARQSVELLAHRGPDDQGVATLDEGVLVHRRLSILDPTPAGHQPFRSASGRVVLVHNGEIYNYLELRQELAGLGHTFHTDTDTEVVAIAYEEWGDRAIERFNGMWAFALWDAARKRLLLSRDRMGVKPMYFVRLGRGIAFASEIKALRSVAPHLEPNLSALRDFALNAWQDHADATFYQGIEPLPPATNIVCRPGELTAQRYWDMPAVSDDCDPRPSQEDEVEAGRFQELLWAAVRLQLRSDAALGSCLSGGLDSASIVAISARLVAQSLGPHAQAPRLALTASFPGSPHDESRLADKVASLAGVEHHLVRLELHDLIETLDEVLAEQDEPFLSSSILAQRAVMMAARQHGIKVMLDGQGADELLAGYPHYRYAWLLGLARRHPLEYLPAVRSVRSFGITPALALRQTLLEATRLGQSGRAPVGSDSRIPAWIGVRLRRADPLPLRDGDPADGKGTPLARQLRRAIRSTSLPALLRYEDRNSMRFGVEARVPYLDHRLVEAALRLPDRLHIDRHGTTKAVLRHVVRGLIPEEVRQDRRKIGFATPQERWLDESMAMIRATFSGSRAVADGILDPAGVADLMSPRPGAGRSSALWRALSIERWLRTF